MNSSARVRARRLQRLLALLAAITLLIGLVSPVSAAGGRSDASKYDPRVWGYDYTETDGWNFAFHAPVQLMLQLSRFFLRDS